MATRIPATPATMRKAPLQARSRATVACILEAGARVLGDKGWAGFNTNEVASAAGVSIGSLYQYFPDKLALISAIRQRHLDDVLAVLQNTPPAHAPLPAQVASLVDGMIQAHSIHPALHRVLLEVAPPSAPSPSTNTAASSIYHSFHAEYLARYRALVRAAAPTRNKAACDTVVHVLSAAMEGVIHSAARNGTLQSKALRRELVHLVCAYLSPATASAPHTLPA